MTSFGPWEQPAATIAPARASSSEARPRERMADIIDPPASNWSILVEHLAPRDRPERPVQVQRDALAYERDGPVGHRELQPARVPAAERVARRPLPEAARAQRRDGDAGVRRYGDGADGSVGVGPGVPGDQFGDVLADHV